MQNQSPRAAREGLALQRSQQLFSTRKLRAVLGQRERTDGAMPEIRRDIVRHGLIGFVPASAQ